MCSLKNRCRPQIQSRQTFENQQVKDAANMIADIYEVGPLTYPKVFQCDNGSEVKAEVPKML